MRYVLLTIVFFALPILYWGAIVYVIYHFVSKYW